MNDIFKRKNTYASKLKKKIPNNTVDNVYIWIICGVFWQQSEFLIDKTQHNFSYSLSHLLFLYEAHLELLSIQATDKVVFCIKYQKIRSDCKVQIAQALHCKHSVVIMEHCFITAFSSCFYVVNIQKIKIYSSLVRYFVGVKSPLSVTYTL